MSIIKVNKNDVVEIECIVKINGEEMNFLKTKIIDNIDKNKVMQIGVIYQEG